MLLRKGMSSTLQSFYTKTDFGLEIQEPVTWEEIAQRTNSPEQCWRRWSLRFKCPCTYFIARVEDDSVHDD